jgi:hypothetical protein
MSKEIVLQFLTKQVAEKLKMLQGNPSQRVQAETTFHLINTLAMMKSVNEGIPLSETFVWAHYRFSSIKQKVVEAQAIAPISVEEASKKMGKLTSSIFDQASETGELKDALNERTAEFVDVGSLIKNVLTGQVTDLPPE